MLMQLGNEIKYKRHVRNVRKKCGRCILPLLHPMSATHVHKSNSKRKKHSHEKTHDGENKFRTVYVKTSEYGVMCGESGKLLYWI